MRICKKCELPKLLEDFCKNKKCKEGRTYVCKKCSNDIHRDTAREYYREYRLENKENTKDYQKNYWAKYCNKKQNKEAELKRKISIEKYLISKRKTESSREKHFKIFNDLNDQLAELRINNI